MDGSTNILSAARSRAGSDVAILAGERFLVADHLGDVVPDTQLGFYAADTRFLSTYILELNGQRLMPLVARTIGRQAARFYATSGATGELEYGALTLVREQRIGSALRDDLALTNYSMNELRVDLTLRCAADFLDLFEVRQLNNQRPAFSCTEVWDKNHLVFTCQQEGIVAHTTLAFSRLPQPDGSTARFHVRLRPQQTWRLSTQIAPSAEAPVARTATESGSRPRQNQRLWRIPTLRTWDADLSGAYQQAVADLQSLEMITEHGHRVVAAGLPWFVALFGRDSLLTAYETLLWGPALAIEVLEALAEVQSTEIDDFRDAEPGKIPHEVRSGRLARLGRVPHTRYYGTVDATTLWLILLSETYRWTGNLELVRRLWPAAEAALNWIDAYGDLDGDGFVEYARRSPSGLDNQGWKDSWDAIQFSDGRLAHAPIALAEVQGYVYDAKLRCAELVDLLDQPARAESLRRQAAALKDAFNTAFWLPRENYYALALDRDKRPVDSVSSNPGHALWSGIVDEEKAPAVARRLLSSDLFSGWGVRTLSSRMRAYNPISYHNGSVWPHDTALIAAGLARYGFRNEALRAMLGLLQASSGFERNRLPELFAGFERRSGDVPPQYPAANAPQAWSAGAVVLCVRTLLGIEPDGPALRSSPIAGAPQCELRGVYYRGRKSDVVARPS